MDIITANRLPLSERFVYALKEAGVDMLHVSIKKVLCCVDRMENVWENNGEG